MIGGWQWSGRSARRRLAHPAAERRGHPFQDRRALRADQMAGSYVVRDANGQALVYVYSPGAPLYLAFFFFAATVYFGRN
jgi:hypothetical protein